MIGIYKITSPIKRIYIGQSINIEKRFQYYQTLNCKKQIKLYRSLKKYGIENHQFEIVEKCEIENLNKKERYYQDLYDCLNVGLNCKLTNTDDKFGKLSKITKLKISNSMLGKRLFKKYIKKVFKNKTKKFEIKTIYQYDLNYNLIKTWKSYQELIPNFPNKEIYIWNCLRGVQKTSCKSIWSYDKLIQ